MRHGSVTHQRGTANPPPFSSLSSLTASSSSSLSEEESNHSMDESHLLRKPLNLSRIQEEDGISTYFDQPSSSSHSLAQIASCILLTLCSLLIGAAGTYCYLAPHLALPAGNYAASGTILSPADASADVFPQSASNGLMSTLTYSGDVSELYDPAVTSGAMAAAGAAHPLPGAKVINFTVEAALPPSRWPASVDKESHQSSAAADAAADATAAFLAGSPQRFQGAVRGAIVSLYTPNQHPQLMGRFDVNDQLFYSAMADHTDIIIFYTVYPETAGLLLHTDLVALRCRELTNVTGLSSLDPTDSDIYARLRHPAVAFPLEMSSIREFVSERGSHILTVPIAVNLPQHVANDIGKLARPDWMKCAGHKWSMGYVLFSGAVFSSKLLLHPILRGYDYFIKMDLDIRFLRPVPGPSLFHSMHEQTCVWMHSQYSSRKEDCGIDGPEAVEAWASEHSTTPASAPYKWWKSLDYFYGNFVGGWLGWVRSLENRQLATYLYENERHPGYFQHRWGDQPPFAKMLGMWFPIADDAVHGKNRTSEKQPVRSQVCNYGALRKTVFIHE